ncbi:putative laccase-9 [Cajanus cajan]|uniref:putative laccase-9 n=1 Tax=Cajanus cajan TaxID=3821 RepID=UPI0010FAE106|nr:putative laccase-9 [Cajanus cajan]
MILENHRVLLVILGFLVVCKSQANVHYYDFVLKEKNFTKLCSTKSILTVNDSFPGPTIRVQKGDTAFVTVHNQGRYGVTIHWLLLPLCLSFLSFGFLPLFVYVPKSMD